MTPEDSPRPPVWLQRWAATGWRVLILAAAAALLLVVVGRLRVVVVPLVLALLIAAGLTPPARWLKERGVPDLIATWIVVLLTAAVLAAAGWFLVQRFADEFALVGPALGDAYGDVRSWLVKGPLGLSEQTVKDAESAFADRAREFVTTGLTSQAALVVEVVTGFFLTVVVAFFYVKDGETFRDALLTRVPRRHRKRAVEAAAAGWDVLQRYLLGVIVVGFVDAVLIGIGLALIGVPLVVPLMALTFLAAFFPLVGAIFAGGMATLLALAAGGGGDALLVAGLTIGVQQLDGDVVAPLVYSRAVDLHPLAVLLALTTGAVLAGVLGAFLAVPVLAVSVAARRAWSETRAEKVTSPS